MSFKQHNPPHPGEFINEVYIKPFDLVPSQVATRLDVNKSTFNRLLNCESGVTPEMALKLSIVFGRSPESWLFMQDHYDLHKAKKETKLKGITPLELRA